MQTSVILFVAFGLLIGALARMSVPDGEAAGRVLSTLSIVTGVGGALSGAYFGRIFGLYRETETLGITISLATAIACVAACEVTVSHKPWWA